ncbi:23S rRNA (uracil(1939)-C(5))-methyltransferase RlmD [Kingella oralis]|jgi:23S rRNA (uracil-5-)-methyltransferase rumA|uniref:23S rRNA (uracil(1939)-C(5))-methyltransferase RlmD n=1 Tax=Kingella oralis TaxID=505 RepID=UPI0034E3C73C
MTTVHILSLDYESRGVAKLGGKTVFVHNALPQETVRIRITQDKAHFAEAQVEQIVQPSPYRRAPACPHYGDCGGCAMQHVEFAAQVAMKQRVFEEQLQRIGKVQPESLLPPVYGTPWHYRSRTRLAVHTSANGKVVLGYQAKRSHKIVGINQCLLLPEHVSGCLNIIRDALQDMVNAQPKVGIRSVEISVGEGVTAVNIISHKRQPENVLRALAGCLNRRGGKQIWQVWQQIGSAKPQAVSPQDAPPLVFRLPEFGLTMPFQLGDFTQVNLPLNEIMVARAVRYLDPQPHERIADLFCGLGNFTLPLATRAAEVVGIEGSAALTQRAIANARANGLHNAQFATADLFTTTPETLAALGRFDKMLLDPPRAGAYAVVQALQAPYLPQRIVYISCNPATFARDAAVLVGKGYRFKTAGMMNLFPQTSHVEAIGLFEWNARA